MNKKLHSVSPESGPNSNLDLTPQLAQSSSAFLFEPKNIVPFESALVWQKNFQKSLIEEPFSPQAVWLLEHFSLLFILNKNHNPLPHVRVASDANNICKVAPKKTLCAGMEILAWFLLEGKYYSHT